MKANLFTRVAAVVALSFSSLLAFDIDSALAKLSGQKFLLDETDAGLYKLFDTSGNKWFLYIHEEKYLKIHETGASTRSMGAKSYSATNFTQEPLVSLLSVTFPTNFIGTGGDDDTDNLSGKTFSLDSSSSGIYKRFDTENELWLLWIPQSNFLKIHETGASTRSKGAVTVDIDSTFEGGINFTKDPFGDISENSIQFGPLKDGIISTTNSKPMFNANALSSISFDLNENVSIDISNWATDIDGDGISYVLNSIPSWLTYDEISSVLSGTSSSSGTFALSLIANDGNGGSAQHVLTLTVVESSADLEYPPQVPDVNTTTTVEFPPAPPTI